MYTVDEFNAESADETEDIDFQTMLMVANQFSCNLMKLACEYDLVKAGIDKANAASD